MPGGGGPASRGGGGSEVGGGGSGGQAPAGHSSITGPVPREYPRLPDPDDVAIVRPENPANANLDFEIRRKDPNTGNQPDGSWEGQNGQRLTPTENAQVQEFAANAIRAADNVTPRLDAAITRADPHATLVGLEDRVKFADSLKGKVSTQVMRDGLSVDEVLVDINDSVRYTVQAPAASYSRTVDSVMADMRSQGMELVRFKNTWGSDGYKGINTTWRDPSTGTLFELQFHTPESFHVKTVSHDIYERLRLPSLAQDVRDLLSAENAKVFAGLRAPDGAVEISHYPQP